jgi:hypothetical protein
MAVFSQTESALAELSANNNMRFGTHTRYDLASGVPGLIIGEQIYDPAKHLGSAINPMSFLAEVTGEQYVQQVLPSHSLDMKLIIDRSARQEDPRITAYKARVGREVASAIHSALPGIGDNLHAYVLGNHEDDTEAEFIEATSDPKTNAKMIADVCMGGLAFVISDFGRLPLAAQSDDSSEVIAVKVNHPFELALPANVGTISLGGLREVRTNKAKELTAYNDIQSAGHQAIYDSFEVARIPVASVRFDHKQPLGFDDIAADSAIAGAVQAIQYL